MSIGQATNWSRFAGTTPSANTSRASSPPGDSDTPTCWSAPRVSASWPSPAAWPPACCAREPTTRHSRRAASVSRANRSLPGLHPDLLEVGLPEGKNVVPISVLVGDGESRGRAGLCYDLSLLHGSDRRVAILDDADHLERDGYSALLKTLEEPPARSVMILVAGSEADIRDTIRSRCQLIRFSSLPTPMSLTC
ncbi:MAG: hypothetical protein CM1200mP2_47830 [Planctomycetaceae bacterium]|nr:MAG: hypothetical protein CM1200mP2_47830 [Planctomycetaceae bacterium]